MKNADMPAAPLVDPELWVDSFDPSKGTCEAHGLTKREYFAGQAMQGLCTSARSYHLQGLIEASVRYADALLAELEKGAR